MKTRTKALLLALSAVLLVVSTVFSTLAYLKATSDVATNTFTVGNVQISLDEAKVNEYGVPVDANGNEVALADAPRQLENTYRLLPGRTYTKDPTVTVTKNSENCYVRMLVKISEADMDKLKAAFPVATYPTYYNGEVFLLQNLVPSWSNAVWASTNEVTLVNGNYVYEFRYVNIVERNQTDDQVLPALFTEVVIPGTLDYDAISNLNDVKIKIEAHAIQADGFGTAALAWAEWPLA